jgi:hypothetical protein
MNRAALFWGSLILLFGLFLLLESLGIIEDINAFGLVFAIFLIFRGVWGLLGRMRGSSGKGEQNSLPLEGALTAKLRIEPGIGKLRLGASENPDNLYEGYFGGGFKLYQKREGDLLYAKLQMPGERIFMIFPGESLEWEVGVNKLTPMTIFVENGIGESQIDLSGIEVEKFTLSAGLGASKLTLPIRAGTTQIRVKGGIGLVEIKIPSEVAAKIRVERGLGAFNIDRSRFPRMDGAYISPNYDQADNKVEVKVSTGIGSICTNIDILP